MKNIFFKSIKNNIDFEQQLLLDVDFTIAVDEKNLIKHKIPD